MERIAPFIDKIRRPRRSYAVLAPVSRCYSPLQGRLPTCYSPVRRFTQVVAPLFSLDLHVLGTPPALILSQDQTLKITCSLTVHATDRIDSNIINVCVRFQFSKSHWLLGLKLCFLASKKPPSSAWRIAFSEHPSATFKPLGTSGNNTEGTSLCQTESHFCGISSSIARSSRLIHSSLRSASSLSIITRSNGSVPE